MTAPKITPEETMQKILTQWPETIPVFLAHKMSCIGCYMSSFDTLEEALSIHGLPVNDLVKKLNDAVRHNQTHSQGEIHE